MTSVCLTHQNHLQKFSLINSGTSTMLAQHHHHQQQQQQHINFQAPTKHHTIAPAPNSTTKQSTNVLGINNSMNMQSGIVGPLMKKKYTYANMPYGEQLPSVARRNARERNRVKQVNNGFSTLRQHIPQTIINSLTSGGRGASKKLSKVDTLRIAVEYIRGLQDLLDNSDDSSEDNYGSQGTGSPSPSTYYGIDSPDSKYHLQATFNSEASASPTSSYSDSDISIGGANYLQPNSMEHHPHHQQQQQPSEQSQIQFKFEPYDNYGNDVADTPDDDEILDYISSWQQDE